MSESLIYTALAPLLSRLAGAEGGHHERAGLLVAGYAIGYWLGALPAYNLVRWLGARLTATLGVAAVAVATLMFAYSSSFPELMGSRVLVGLGSVVAYSGILTVAAALVDRARRGAAIGWVYSGSAVGLAVGPLLGSLAWSVGLAPVFTALACVQALIALLLSRLPVTAPVWMPSPLGVLRHLRVRQVQIGLWITSLPGFTLGVLTVSGTYRLQELQASPFLVAIAFSGIAVLDVILAPRIGRASDHLGRRQPLMLALTAATISIALIAVTACKLSTVVLIAIAGGLMLAVAGPGLALIGDVLTQDNGEPSSATLLMNVAWGPAASLGAITSGLVHGALGAEVSFLMLMALAAVSIAAVGRFA